MSDNDGLFRVVVAGSRSFDNYEMMCRHIDRLVSRKEDGGLELSIISGGADGADTLAKKYAKERRKRIGRGCWFLEMPAEWDKYGRRAGYVRNCEMADHADAVIVFWDGESPGSKMMIDIANERGIPLRIVRF